MNILEHPNDINIPPIDLESIEAPFDRNVPISWPKAGKDTVDEHNTSYFISNMNPFLLAAFYYG